jgi:hypothetical protein
MKYRIDLDSLELNFLEVAVDTLLEELHDVVGHQDLTELSEAGLSDMPDRIEIGERIREQFKRLRKIKIYQQKTN